MSTRRGATGLGIALGGTAVLVLLLIAGAAPAGAILTQNEVGCEGSAVITDPDGETYRGSASDVKVKVPKEGTAAWQGSVGTVTHNHFGEIELELGIFSIPLGDWSSPNDLDVAASSGTEDIPDAVQWVPPGQYRVTGFHQGDEGRCAGYVIVDVQGSATSSPIGIGALIGTVVTGAGLGFSAKAKGAK